MRIKKRQLLHLGRSQLSHSGHQAKHVTMNQQQPSSCIIHTHTHKHTHIHTHTHTWRWREKRKGATPVVHVLITAIVSLSLPLSSASFLSCSCLVFQKKAFAVRRNAAQAARHTVAPPEAPEPPCLPSRVRASPSFSSVSLSSVSVPSQSLC